MHNKIVKGEIVMIKKLFTIITTMLAIMVINGQTVQAEEKQWELNEITFNKDSSYQVGTDIEIIPDITGDRTGLKYKYVWMKDNWNQWGVLKDFSEDASFIWTPDISGKYYIYVDVTDTEGNSVTKSVEVNVETAVYHFHGISSNLHSTHKTGSNLNISAEVSGNKSGLTYKFVWMKNNWEKWDVIKDFDSEAEVEWSPSEKGEYKIYVDIKDGEGKTSTYTRDFIIKNYVWSFDDIKTNVNSPLEKHNMPVTIEAITHGEEGGLEYKFVWMKDDWEKWGVIQEFGSSNTAQWNTKESGDYFIYVDVRDKEGEMISERIPFSVLKDGWQYDKVDISPENMHLRGEEIHIAPNVSGYVNNLTYKYVWMKDDWKSWGVIKDFSDKNKITWKLPDDTGQYEIFVDVKDDEGDVQTQSVKYWNVKSIWHVSHMDIGDSQENTSPQIYTEIPLNLHVSEDGEDLLYEFVAERLGDSQRQTIQKYSKNQSAVWYPKEAGDYRITGYVKDGDGRVETTERRYSIREADWKVDEVLLSRAPIISTGENISVDLSVSGQSEGLQYKYVWMKDNWSQWGVIKEYDNSKSITWTPNEPGLYYIYIDVMDQRGVVFDPIVETINAYEYQSVGISTFDLESGQTVNVYPEIKGSCIGAEFKYVWMRDNWSEWGVIQDFSSAKSVTWTPQSAGDYTIYIDMRIENEVICTKTKSIHVNPAYMSKINEIRQKYIYTPYRWGGTSPSGWDCSGFTQWSLRYLGVNIPRTAAMQSQGGQAINPFDMEQWKPGDIICYANNSGTVSHAALYLGNGELMHALNTRWGTFIQDVDYYEWWDVVTHRVTVRRYL